MIMQDNEARAYFAGLFDGDGYVMITRKWIYEFPQHDLAICISNNDRRPLDMLADSYGGNVTQHRNHFYWRRWSYDAVYFLQGIQEFVVIKKEQIAVAISFQDNKRCLQGRCVESKTSMLEIASRELAYRELQNLKKIGD